MLKSVNSSCYVFVDFVFVYLASINHRAKLTTEVAHTPAIQLSQVGENRSISPPTSPGSVAPGLLHVPVTHQDNSPPSVTRLGIRKLETVTASAC